MSVYGALLHLYPVSFRREYGAQMRDVFTQRMRTVHGIAGVIALWADAVADTLAGAAAVHWDVLRQDVRYTVRTLSRSPGFALTAVLVTALGVGANTAAFSVADFVLIRPLPFADANRIVRVWESPPGSRTWELELSPPNFRDVQAASTSFESMGAFHPTAANLVGQGEPVRVLGSVITPGVLHVLGVAPALGRTFSDSETVDRDGGSVILSYGLWRQHFGGDSAVLGKTMLFDGSPMVVAGVMPESFHFPDRDVAYWASMPNSQLASDDRTDNWFEVVARLKSGVPAAHAQTELDVIMARLRQQYPKDNAGVGAYVNGLRDEVSGQSRLLLVALCGAATCVLLIACANLANLLIARALARRRELDVRAALGAGWERLARQLVTESLALSFAGGAVGILLATIGLPVLARLVPDTLPIAQQPTIDARMMAFAAIVAIATGIGVGVLPALRMSSRSNLAALRESARAGGGRRARVRSLLVIGEVVASVVLLVSAGLLMRALADVESRDPGFRANGVLTIRTALPLPRYDSVAVRQQYFTDVLTRVRALPGVERAAYVTGLPMSMTGGIWPVALTGDAGTRAPDRNASLRFMTPGFFSVLGIPLKLGRDIDDHDTRSSLFVAVVSESFARKYWPNENAIGKRFQFALSERTVIGVAGDVRVRGLERTSEPQVYLPAGQVADRSLIGYIPKDLVIRTTVPPASLAAAVRRAVHEVDAAQPVSNVQTLESIVASTTAPRAVQVRVLAAFALVAFLLAAIGIHGVLAFSVAQRKHEFGVRMALGAQPGSIVRMVVRQGAVLAMAGVIPGVLLAYAAGRGMQSLLAGVTPTDPATFTAVTALCIVMTIAGSVMPVMRAVRVAPASVFRGE